MHHQYFCILARDETRYEVDQRILAGPRACKRDVQPESVSSSCVFQAKYREASKKQASTALYHQLPETMETKHAKEASLLQSQVQTLMYATVR